MSSLETNERVYMFNINIMKRKYGLLIFFGMDELQRKQCNH